VTEWFQCEVRHKGEPAGGGANGYAELEVRGEVDLVNSAVLQRAIIDVIAAGSAEVVVDMAETSFIDAAGIGALMAAANEARRAGGRLVLRAPSPAVRRVVDVLDLSGLLPIE
jgi:anti-sigma B factor antagonist